tara:strand:+ start:122 stop:322 length:201 start_codon:yes stop_codon:yes gene_type:complete
MQAGNRILESLALKEKVIEGEVVHVTETDLVQSIVADILYEGIVGFSISITIQYNGWVIEGKQGEK